MAKVPFAGVKLQLAQLYHRRYMLSDADSCLAGWTEGVEVVILRDAMSFNLKWLPHGLEHPPHADLC